MSCRNVCKLCKNLIISESVTFAGGTLTINIPAGSYNNGQKYCVVVAQAIPATTTITAPVVITIGDGTVEYPVVNSCCAPVTACSIRTRTKYSSVVSTSSTGGTFKLIGKSCCAPNYNLSSINGTLPVTEGGVGA